MGIKALIICLLLLLAVLFYYVRHRDLLRVKRWQKLLNLPVHRLVFQQLYSEVDGFALSRQARIKQDAIEYVYGEIEFVPFIALLSLVKPDVNTIFYDLGSGTGKAVLACAMVYPIQKSVGVELFPELYQNALRQTEKLALVDHYATKANKIHFIQGDFLEIDLHEATLVFINSTTLVGTTWEILCGRLNTSPLLNTVITTSKPLLASNFTLAKTTKVQMSWGVVMAYIHTRKTNLN